MADDNKPRKVRLSLEVTDELNRALDEMAQQNGSTKSEVLRKAIALFEAAIEAKKSGRRIAFTDDNDQVVTRIINL